MKDLQNLLSKYPSIFVVYDRNVEGFASGIAAGRPSLAIEASEHTKNMDTVVGICRWLLEMGANRDALVLAVGGGVTTDMVGFAASIYKRGVKYANVPTTLLSQVDAAIGGKTGVNLDSLKNMLGVIVQPEFTFISAEPLRTLPESEFRSGCAELLKTFIIRNENGNYEKAVQLLSAPEPDLDALAPLIKAAGDVKRDIVKQDPYEHGLRRVLNLGHTYAHAIEWWLKGGISHGAAVAIGMVCAARLSEQMGVAQPGLAARLEADFKACKLPTELPCPESELKEAMGKDKKAASDGINFVLVEKIGSVVIKKI